LKFRSFIYGMLPQHFLSRLGGWMARRRWGVFTHLFTRWFVRHYRVRLDEAVRATAAEYTSFADFFTRSLREDARTWPAEPGALGSPVDGLVSQLDRISDGRLIQAKGIEYPLADLLDGDPDRYLGGSFTTLYLRPQDYHRVHMPADGRLMRIRHIPGRLWPVRPWAVSAVPGLFARNERVVLEFDGHSGPWAMVLVGAMMVGSMETVVTGPIRGGRGEPARWNLEATACEFKRGDEIGRFNFGSTVVLVFGPGQVAWNRERMETGREIRLGQPLGYFNT
jgi:phosphatidylserine decarboxylase